MDMFPLWLSLRVALTATALTLVIGIPLALLLARRRFPGKNVLEAAVVLPLVLPPTVLGYYLLLVIGSRGPVGRALGALGLELAFTWGAAVLAAGVLAFCRALGEFGITLMVAGNIPGRTQTLPLAIYDRVQGAQMGEANALALIAVAVVVVLLFGLSRVARLRY